jgi:hypothetical protein
MYALYFNERRQIFTIIESGVTVSEFYDGHSIARSESVEELRGIAKGFIYARFCNPPMYTVDSLIKAALVEVNIKEKKD